MGICWFLRELVPGSVPRRFRIVSVLKKQLRNDLSCSFLQSLEVRSMQRIFLMYYISAEPLLLKAQVGFVRRHKSSAPFWLLGSSWQSWLFPLNGSHWYSPQILFKPTHRLCRLVGRAPAQWAGGHGSESHRRLLVTQTCLTLMDILSILLKGQLSQCLCSSVQRKLSRIYSL